MFGVMGWKLSITMVLLDMVIKYIGKKASIVMRQLPKQGS